MQLDSHPFTPDPMLRRQYPGPPEYPIDSDVCAKSGCGRPFADPVHVANATLARGIVRPDKTG